MSLQIVEQVKAQLRGMDLSGPCGAFQITKRVAWQLRMQGFGLLSKPTGNNCEGYATDIVVDRMGGYYDILGDGGGANIPQWPSIPESGDLTRWRPAIDPGDVAPPPPDPVPVPPPPTPAPVDLQPILDAIDALRTQVGAQHLSQARSFEVMELGFRQMLDKQDRAYTGNTKAFGGALVLRPKADA